MEYEKKYKKSAFRNHVWLLYSDLNSRFNTLVEECIHLQNTLFGLLPDAFLCENVFGNDVENGMRPWRNDSGIRNIEACMNKEYYDMDSRHKTFATLIDLLGGLIVGLEKNQCTCQQSYLAFIKSHDQKNEATIWQKDYYWFVSIRGYFIDGGFEFYADQLEHAHEKLVEVLENFPGMMPQPILMRRWNSAMYENFLSGYFRNARWRVGSCISKLKDEKKYEGEYDVLSHSWTHIPTSEISLFEINSKDKTRRYGTVRSAFFYLEQPGLFPLLYHECAHYFFPHECDQPFFRSRDDLASVLRNKFPWQVQNSDWLASFTEEIWIDAISVALGGIPYVAALFSQLFGRPLGEFEMSEGIEGVYELEKFGTDKVRAFNGQELVESEAYLWVARLKLAARLCSQLNKRKCCKAESEWLNSTKSLFDEWQEGGKAVYGKEKTSEDHETLWGFRGKVNDWVEGVIWSYLEIHLDDLRRAAEDSQNYCFPERDNNDGAQADVKPLEAIKIATKNYLKKTLAIDEPNVSTLDQLTHIDACPVAVRWTIGEEICKKIVSEEDPEKRRDWLDVFSKYVRHDGHSGFRLAMEWHLVRESVFEYMRDIVRETETENDSEFKVKNHPECGRHKIREFITKELPQLNSDDNNKTFLDWLRHRKYGNCPAYKDFSENLVNIANEAVSLANKIADNFVEILIKAMAGDEIPVSTLTMGMIRPSEISNPKYDVQQPYIAAFRRVFEHISVQTKKLNEVRNQVGINVKIKSTVLPVVGDYSFVHVMRGITPVERSFQPKNLPKMVTKPRTVLHVSGKLFDGSNNGELCSWGKLNGKVGKVGKVSLIRYKYRFEWLDLLQRVEEVYKSEENYSLFLSSSWEDAILITCDVNPVKMDENRRNLGIVSNGVNGVDAQSCLMFNIDCLDGIETPYHWDTQKDWEVNLKTNIFNDTAFRKLATLGRYDTTIVFHSDDTAASSPKEKGAKAINHPTEVAKAFVRCPKEFWKPIAGYSTSVGIEEDIFDGPPKFSFISRFVLDE